MIWVSIVIVAIMTGFALFGLVDLTFLKNKFGLGTEFKKGIEMIGPLCLAIVGIISSVPLLTYVIEHTVSPWYQNMGLDPSMAITSVLAIDMGGYQIAMSVASNELIGQWAGIVYGSMMGATIVFSIPVGLAAIKKKDIQHFAKGVLFGIVAIPFGTFVGGVMLNIPITTILLNLVPPIIFSVIIAVCLILFPNGTIRVFKWFAISVSAFGMICLAFALVKDLVLTPIANTGAFVLEDVPFISKFAPTSDGILVAGSVGLVLSGALPFIAVINRLLKKPLKNFSKKTNSTEYGVSGYLLSAANNMAMFTVLDKMNDNEKIYNVSFAVCSAFVIGDHLAFAAANAPACIVPMMIAKLISGLFAVFFAFIYIRIKQNHEAEKHEKKRI